MKITGNLKFYFRSWFGYWRDSYRFDSRAVVGLVHRGYCASADDLRMQIPVMASGCSAVMPSAGIERAPLPER